MSLAKPLTVSASQVETFRLCHRKWWLEKVAKQPTQDKGYFDFGTVLHAVCERYLKADNRGLDVNTNEPVELFPEGWHIAEDSKVAMDAGQQELIRKLIGEAIERGILQRLPGREVEAEFTRPLFTAEDDQLVHITGFIDYLLPDQVQDHKTVGNWRYAKSGDALQNDAQMLIYAGELAMRLIERGLPVPEKILVRHNQFGKDPLAPRISTATGWVTQVDIAAEMARVVADAYQMLEIRKIESWTDVPDASKAKACLKFGGCDFQRICLGELDLAQHHDLTIRLNRDRLATRTSHQHGDASVMGTALTELLESRTKAAGGKIPSATGPAPELNSGLTQQLASQSTPAAPAAPAAAAAAAVEKLPQETAPWYDEGCPACSGNAQRGVKSSGKMACMVCDGNRRKKGLSTSADYLTEPSDIAGRLKWTELKSLGTKAPVVVTGEAAVAAPLVVAVRETKSVAAPVAAIALPSIPSQLIETTARVIAAPIPSDAPTEEQLRQARELAAEDAVDELYESSDPNPTLQLTAKKGRPKKGITLLVGCCRLTTAGKPMLLSKVIRDFIETIEKDPANGGKSFWSLPSFPRKDAICSFAKGFAAANPGVEIVCDSTRLTETAFFLDVLRGCPEVTDVIVGLPQ